MSVACYVRVTNRQNADVQRGEIQRWLNTNGVDPALVVWYADEESGDTIDRPEFDRLQRGILDGTVKTVVLWRLDRLSPRLLEGMRILASWCESFIKIVVVAQQIKVYGYSGQMLLSMLSGLLEIGTEDRRTRQLAGIAEAKDKGKHLGRKPGTTKSQPARARELRDKGMATGAIAQELGVSQRTAFRYLSAGNVSGWKGDNNRRLDVSVEPCADTRIP